MPDTRQAPRLPDAAWMSEMIKRARSATFESGLSLSSMGDSVTGFLEQGGARLHRINTLRRRFRAERSGHRQRFQIPDPADRTILFEPAEV